MESSPLTLNATITDDVQVQAVDLLVNGQTVRTDVAFPFDLSTYLPSIAAAGNSVSVQVRATDTGGNTALSQPLTINLLPSGLPDGIASINPADGSSQLEGTQVIRILLMNPISAASLATAPVQVVSSSGVIYSPSQQALFDDGRELALVFPNLLADTYSLVIHAAQINDTLGNPIGNSDVTNQFTLTYRSTLTTTVADLDPTTPGIQILEATEVPMHIAVDPGTNVDYIDLYANGVDVARAAGLSADFTVLAPILSSGMDTLTVRAHVTDSSGFTTLSNPIVFDLLKDTTPPSVVSIDPSDGASLLEGNELITIQFSKPLAKPLNTNAFELDDSSGNAHSAAFEQLLDDDQEVQLRYSDLLADDYRLVIHAPLITDRPGNPLGASEIVSQFTLTYRASLSTTVADVDPNTPGLQVFEGTTIPLTVSALPGIVVQEIDLVADGVVVGTSTTAPADFSVIAPDLAAGSDTLVVQARVTDEFGFTTLTPTITFDILKDTTPPHLLSIDPPDGAVLNHAVQSITMQFDKSIAKSVTTASFSVVEAGPDGTFDDADDVVKQVTGLQFSNDDTILTVDVEPLASGNYRLEIDQTAITDRAGNPLGAGYLTTGFVIQNVIFVSNTADSGPGSLRDAIESADAATGAVDIDFFIPTSDANFTHFDNSLIGGNAAGNAFVIRPTSALPALDNSTGGITIDGSTQTTFGGDTNPFGPEIVLDGSSLDPSDDSSGITIQSDGNAVYGLDIVHFDGHFSSSFSDAAAILIEGGSGNVVAANYLGIDPTGTIAEPNGNGVHITGNGSSNLVGGNGNAAPEAERNVISGNESFGVWIEGPSVFTFIYQYVPVIDGNYIGTDASGTQPVGNGADGVTISGNVDGGRVGAGSSVFFNFGLGNTIAFNNGLGVSVYDDANVNIEQNSIFSNTGSGIFANTGSGIVRFGNTVQNIPTLTAAGFNGTTWVRGSFNGAPNASFTLDFYANTAPDPSGYGQGQRFLDSIIVTTDFAGSADFTAPLYNGTAAVGEYVTATATDMNGDTSQFSNAFVVQSFSSLEPNDTIAEAFDTGLTSATPGTYSANGTIGNNLGDQTKDVDMFLVQLNAGDRIQVAIDTSSNPGFDSYLRLFDAAGNELAFNDNGPPPGGSVSTDSFLDFIAPAGGSYYIGVSGAGNDQYDPNVADSGTAGSTGAYNISLTLTNQG